MARVERRLKQLADACRNGHNVMPVLVDAVKDYASLGEIADVYRQVFGLYREPIIFEAAMKTHLVVGLGLLRRMRHTPSAHRACIWTF